MSHFSPTRVSMIYLGRSLTSRYILPTYCPTIPMENSTRPPINHMDSTVDAGFVNLLARVMREETEEAREARIADLKMDLGKKVDETAASQYTEAALKSPSVSTRTEAGPLKRHSPSRQIRRRPDIMPAAGIRQRHRSSPPASPSKRSSGTVLTRRISR